MSRFRLACAALLASAALTAATLTAPSAAYAADPAPAYPRLRVGSLNTDLQPWLPGQAAVVDTIAATDLDVLALQGVYSQQAANAIIGDPRIAGKYPYSYVSPAYQEPGSCSAFVPISTQEDYINSLIDSGIDTRTVEQPIVPTPFTSQLLGLDLTLTSAPCFEAIVNTMQSFGPEVNPLSAIDRAADSTGVRYAHGGLTGQLILSRSPLQDVSVVPFDAFLLKRANVYATVAGVRLAFVDFPRDVFGEPDPTSPAVQGGALQVDLARDVVTHDPDLVVGTLNSGPGYQPGAYDLLRENGFAAQVDRATYCPTATHANFPPCRTAIRDTVTLPPDLRLDNVLTRTSTTTCTPPTTFATTPVSDHIGIAALCRKAPAFPARPTLDSFNRANGTVGSSWAGLTSSASYRLVDQRLLVQAGGPLVWRPSSFGPVQEASLRLSSIAADSRSQGVLLKVQATSNADAGAISVTYDAKARSVRVSTLRVGARAWTVYPAVPLTYAAGDVLGARSYADGTVDIYRNQSLIASTTLSAADMSFFSTRGGRIGIWTLAATKTTVDDFGGGSLGQ